MTNLSSLKSKKFGDGYTVRNREANMYIGRISGMGYGEGAGFVEEPTEIQLPPSAAVDGSYLIANVKGGLTHGPLLGHQGVFQGEQITGYWGELASPNSSHSWYFDKIDPALLDDIEEITEVEGSLDDGYYFINFSNYSEPSTCMVPVQDGDLLETWRIPPRKFGIRQLVHLARYKKCRRQDLLVQELRRTKPDIH